MILYSSTASPFGRKIKLAAYVLGLIGEISVRPTDTMNPEDEIRTINPLGKIPSLVVGGTALY
ncbi:MAG: glutathione S-transferase N-terminal domain-containing protein, partial [Candidatus Puniceispirillaceae bacterium]